MSEWPTPYLVGHRKPCPSCTGQDLMPCRRCRGRRWVGKTPTEIVNDMIAEARAAEARGEGRTA